MPRLPGYAMDVTRVTYGDGVAYAELSETVTVDGAPLRTPECLTFELTDAGLISASRSSSRPHHDRDGGERDAARDRHTRPHRLPGAHAHWEESAEIADVARIVGEADRLGYDFCTCSEHVAVPVEAAAVRGGTYWDPLPTFGYLAARTNGIRFATFVLVLGYHHPLAIAKRYGTLDLVSGGRLVLGVGVGSLEEEFALLGAEFEHAARSPTTRCERCASLSDREPTYDGEYFAFGGFVVDPAAVQSRVPMWVGGRTARSLRRAVELADGWAPFGLRTAELAAMLDREATPTSGRHAPRHSTSSSRTSARSTR